MMDANQIVCISTSTPEQNTIDLHVLRPSPQRITVLKAEVSFIIDALNRALSEESAPIDYSL